MLSRLTRRPAGVSRCTGASIRCRSISSTPKSSPCIGIFSRRQPLYRDIFATLLSRKLVEVGNLVIFTKGDLTGVSGSTNSMKIIRVAAPD